METKFTDVANFYVGCPMSNLTTLYSVDIEGEWMLANGHHDGCSNFRPEWDERIKPVLRPLSDRTKEECLEIGIILGYEVTDTRPEFIVRQKGNSFLEGFGLSFTQLSDMAAIVKYLTSKHFDIFDLIKNKFAFDKTKFNKQ